MSTIQTAFLAGVLVAIQLVLLLLLYSRHWLWCVGCVSTLSVCSLLLLNGFFGKFSAFSNIVYLVAVSLILLPTISYYFPWYSAKPAEAFMTSIQYSNMYLQHLAIATVSALAGSVAFGLVIQFFR